MLEAQELGPALLRALLQWLWRWVHISRTSTQLNIWRSVPAEKTKSGWSSPEDLFCDVLSAPRPPHSLQERAARNRTVARLCENWSHARRSFESPRARSVVRQLRDLGARTVTLLDSSYPAALREIVAPPAALYVRGPLTPGQGVLVGVVGSRSASSYGRAVARRLAGELADAGVTVVSGFARGIDGEAHRGALDQNGSTAAVLGTGLDICYPSEHRSLMKRLALSGSVLTEYLPGTPPLAHHFPERNRILSGLCHAVVVVEAGERSGALVTAKFALDQNREVCAVPGDVTSPGSVGPHGLLRQGAALVESAADVFAACGLLWPPVSQNTQGDAREAPACHSLSARIPAALAPHLGLRPRTLDELVDATNDSASNLAATLERLVVEGVLRRGPDGYVLARAPHALGSG
jgi:DNA processing protein